MKTSVLSILCLSIALLALAACSDKKEPESVPVSAATSPAPEPEPVLAQQQASIPLLKSSRASFTAKLPCEDCPGIEIGINLQRDEHGGNSFVMHYQRMERDSNSAVISGDWILAVSQVDERPAAVITLNPGNLSRQALLRINNDNSLTLIEGSLNGTGADIRPVFHFTDGKLDLRALYEEELAKGNQE